LPDLERRRGGRTAESQLFGGLLGLFIAFGGLPLSLLAPANSASRRHRVVLPAGWVAQGPRLCSGPGCNSAGLLGGICD
jgi:hypothetical protein